MNNKQIRTDPPPFGFLNDWNYQMMSDGLGRQWRSLDDYLNGDGKGSFAQEHPIINAVVDMIPGAGTIHNAFQTANRFNHKRTLDGIGMAINTALSAATPFTGRMANNALGISPTNFLGKMIGADTIKRIVGFAKYAKQNGLTKDVVMKGLKTLAADLEKSGDLVGLGIGIYEGSVADDVDDSDLLSNFVNSRFEPYKPFGTKEYEIGRGPSKYDTVVSNTGAEFNWDAAINKWLAVGPNGQVIIVTDEEMEKYEQQGLVKGRYHNR